MMKAAVLDAFGGPEAIKIRSVPIPQIGMDEVLIQVEVADIATWDAVEREGAWDGVFGIKSTFPYILGWSGAGTVAALGDKVSGLKIGDRVYAASMPLPNGGFYAEYTTVPSEHVALIPTNLPIEQAGVMPWIALTAASGLQTLNLKNDETFMILGASGGIGHIAIQLAKKKGVRVLAVASGKEGVKLAQERGADLAIDGRTDDVLDAAKKFAPNGIDAALATIGGETVDHALLAIRKGGRVATPIGVEPEPPRTPKGVAMLPFNGDRSHAALLRLNHIVESGSFKVHIAERFQLEDIPKAHRLLGTHPTGRLALHINPETEKPAK